MNWKKNNKIYNIYYNLEFSQKTFTVGTGPIHCVLFTCLQVN